MKKIILTTVITLVLSLSASAQLFKNDDVNLNNDREGNNFAPLLLPQNHALQDSQHAPLTGGAALLITFGAAYAMLRSRKDNK